MTTRAFHVMAKPTGAVCNLDCTYCFYLTKERLYPGSDFRMSDRVLEQYVAQLLAAHAGQPEVVVAFQGGEPTMMGLDFFRRLVEIEQRLVRPGQQVLNTLQTNATLLDDEWAAFLREHDFLVGVSIDGPRDLHDAYRRDKGGKPTFDRVLAGLDALRRHDVEWNALVTVNRANQDHGVEVYRFLRDELGACFVQLIPIVDRQDGQVLPHSVEPAAYGDFLCEVFDEWVRHDVGTVFVQAFDTALAHWLGLEGLGVCVHERTCGSSVALEHTGDVYSCDHYVDPEHRLGTLGEGRTLLELVESPQQRTFGSAKLETLPAQCRSCRVRFACNGGCPKDRFATTPDGEPGLNHLCAGYRRFFEHVDRPMRFMAERVRSGGEAIDVMGLMARRDRTAAEAQGEQKAGDRHG
ncbi:anaerobic sulfatase maturase [Nocardioides sp.]|uniref:anaerobic sulfatase maturase n=1 Tax=Nocardioides sp. TaxID=35761 RepID=UPI003784951E